MIKQALFDQPWITGEEQDDPQIKIHPYVTSYIKDLSQSDKYKLAACKGSRKVTQKRFNIANKEK